MYICFLSVNTSGIKKIKHLLIVEGMAHYAGKRLAPAEGFNRGFFWPWAKKRACNAVLANLGHLSLEQ